jgi:hypothetical protein
MSLLSIFRSKDPATVAGQLAREALTMDITPEEAHWIAKLGVERPRFIAERNALRVGMTEAGVFRVTGVSPRASSPAYKLQLALSAEFEQYFASMPGVEPSEGRAMYHRFSRRYILRMPDEVAGIFHYNLLHPENWNNDEDVRTPPPELPDDFVEFVRLLMRSPIKKALERAQEIDV